MDLTGKDAVAKIAMIVMSQYPGDPRVRREAEAAARHGSTVDIICFRNPGQPPLEEFGAVTAHRIMPVRDKTSIVKYTLFSTRFALAAFNKLQKLAMEEPYDLIQIHNMPDQLVFCALLQRIQGTPVVLDLHDLMVELFESKWEEGRARILLPIVKILEKTSCHFADALITTSDGFRDRLIDRGMSPDKITLVLNSADTNIFHRPGDGTMPRHGRRGSALNAPELVYHGTITERFGVHVLVEAVHILRQRGLEPRLHLHGKYDEDYRPLLESLVGRYRLGSHVHLGGYLSHEEIRTLLMEMDIGVVPYLQDSFMDLALSTKSFEYVAMQLPVVVSRVGSMVGLFGDDAVRYFRPGDASDLADAIQFFCQNPTAREDYPLRADRQYAAIAWPAMERRYIELIESLVG